MKNNFLKLLLLATIFNAANASDIQTQKRELNFAANLANLETRYWGTVIENDANATINKVMGDIYCSLTYIGTQIMFFENIPEEVPANLNNLCNGYNFISKSIIDYFDGIPLGNCFRNQPKIISTDIANLAFNLAENVINFANNLNLL